MNQLSSSVLAIISTFHIYIEIMILADIHNQEKGKSSLSYKELNQRYLSESKPGIFATRPLVIFGIRDLIFRTYM